MSDTIQLKNETDKAVYQTMTAYEASLIQAHLAAITRYATLAMQGAFILNGTVGIAAFSAARTGSVCALVCCAVGALFAVLAACFAYVVQYNLFDIDKEWHYSRVRLYFSRAKEEDVESSSQSCNTLPLYRNVWFCMALGCVAGSLLLFCIGLWQIV